MRSTGKHNSVGGAGKRRGPATGRPAPSGAGKRRATAKVETDGATDVAPSARDAAAPTGRRAATGKRRAAEKGKPAATTSGKRAATTSGRRAAATTGRRRAAAGTARAAGKRSAAVDGRRSAVLVGRRRGAAAGRRRAAAPGKRRGEPARHPGLLAALAVAGLTSTVMLTGSATASDPATSAAVDDETRPVGAFAAGETVATRSMQVIAAVELTARKAVPLQEFVLVAGTVGDTRVVVEDAPTPAERKARSEKPWSPSATGAYGLPATAALAYQRASRSVAGSCSIPWTLLAGIGRVETDHGRFAGSTLGTDGLSRPLIRGIALNGVGPVMAIRDSDRGQLDGDRVWDRAVGPMQFIPTTWASWASDGDGDGVKDPDDLDDAALAAARYLCRWSSDLTAVGNQRGAVRTYNNSGYYVDLVLAYEVGYRTGGFVIPSPTPSATEAEETAAERRERREARRERREARAEARAAAQAARDAERPGRTDAPSPKPSPSSSPSPGTPGPTKKPTPRPSPSPSTSPSPSPSPSPSRPPQSPRPSPTTSPTTAPPTSGAEGAGGGGTGAGDRLGIDLTG